MSLTDDEAQRLRGALTLIATTVEPSRTDVETDSSSNTVDPPRTGAVRSNRARLAAGVLAAAGVAATAALAWSLTDDGQAPENPNAAAESAQSAGEYWACAETIVEGTVTDVQPAGPDRLLVVVNTSRWIKPASGPATLQLDLPDPETQGLPAIRPDAAYLLSVPTNEYLAADVFRGEDIADGLRGITEGRAMAQDRNITECPKYWREWRPTSDVSGTG